MYAIIRTGGKQAKVQEGDVLSVERIKNTDTVSFTPLLIVADDGTVISDRDVLGKASVTAEVVGPSAGPKVDIFKYKAKTGYRRRQGHRQKYTTIKVTKITQPGAAKKASAKKADGDDAEPKAAKPKAKPKAEPKAEKAEAPASEAKASTAKTTTAKTTKPKTTKPKTTAKKAEAPAKADKE